MGVMPRATEQYYLQLAGCGVIAMIRAPSTQTAPGDRGAGHRDMLGIQLIMSTPIPQTFASRWRNAGAEKCETRTFRKILHLK